MATPAVRGALNSFPSHNLAPGLEKSHFTRPVNYFPFKGQKSHFSIGFSGTVLKPGWRLHSTDQIIFRNQNRFRGHRASAGCSQMSIFVYEQCVSTIMCVIPVRCVLDPQSSFMSGGNMKWGSLVRLS